MGSFDKRFRKVLARKTFKDRFGGLSVIKNCLGFDETYPCS